ncbi:hypothetical protein AB6D76_22465 [Vibrio splendidus]
MKELVSAITQATANRLKAPILGSFILSWVTVNHSLVLTFLFSTSEQKIKLLNTESTFWTTEPSWLLSPPMMTIAYPVLATIIYTFGLPLVQHLVDSLKFNFVDSKRIQKKHETDKFKFESQVNVSKAHAESHVDYWREKLSRDLDKWDEQRSAFESDITNLRETRDSLQHQLNSSNSIQTNLSEEVEKLRQDIHELKTEHTESEGRWTNRFNESSNENEALLTENEALLTEKDTLVKQLQESVLIQEQQKERMEKLRVELVEGGERIEELTENEVSTRKLMEKILLLNEDFIQFIESEKFLSNSHQDYHKVYKNTIAPSFREAIQPLKNMLLQERTTLEKARIKAQLKSRVTMSEQQITSLRNKLTELEEQDERAVFFN